MDKIIQIHRDQIDKWNARSVVCVEEGQSLNKHRRMEEMGARQEYEERMRNIHRAYESKREAIAKELERIQTLTESSIAALDVLEG